MSAISGSSHFPPQPYIYICEVEIGGKFLPQNVFQSSSVPSFTATDVWKSWAYSVIPNLGIWHFNSGLTCLLERGGRSLKLLDLCRFLNLGIFLPHMQYSIWRCSCVHKYKHLSLLFLQNSAKCRAEAAPPSQGRIKEEMRLGKQLQDSFLYNMANFHPSGLRFPNCHACQASGLAL